MGNLFGVRRRAPQITAQDRAVLQLKQQRDKIKIYQKKTEQDLESNKQLALQLFQNGMKERAVVVLRRKKCMEDVLTRTDKQLETLESLVTDIEYTQIEVSVVEGLKVGTEALKQLNELMNIDDIQQMMEDNAEAAEKQKEISAILQHTSERYNEEDLLKELEGYKREQQLEEALPEVPEEAVEVLPSEQAQEESPAKEDESGEVVLPDEKVAVVEKEAVAVEESKGEDVEMVEQECSEVPRKQKKRQLELA